jgi:hypothetical protein
MSQKFFGTKTNTAVSTTNDSLAFSVPSTCAGMLKYLNIYAFGILSAPIELVLARSSGGATPGGLITPNPQGALMTTSAITVPTTWGTQPTLGAVLSRISINSNSGVRAMLPPGMEFDMAPSSTLSLRSISGTGLVVVEFGFEQIG